MFAYHSDPQYRARMTEKVHREEPHCRRKQDVIDREQRIREHEAEVRRGHLGFCVIFAGVEI